MNSMGLFVVSRTTSYVVTVVDMQQLKMICPQFSLEVQYQFAQGFPNADTISPSS